MCSHYLVVISIVFGYGVIMIQTVDDLYDILWNFVSYRFHL